VLPLPPLCIPAPNSWFQHKELSYCSSSFFSLMLMSVLSAAYKCLLTQPPAVFCLLSWELRYTLLQLFSLFWFLLCPWYEPLDIPCTDKWRLFLYLWTKRIKACEVITFLLQWRQQISCSNFVLAEEAETFRAEVLGDRSFIFVFPGLNWLNVEAVRYDYGVCCIRTVRQSMHIYF